MKLFNTNKPYLMLILSLILSLAASSFGYIKRILPTINSFIIGDNSLISTLLVPQTLGTTLVFLTIYLLVAEKNRWVTIAAAAATYMHLQLGAYIFVVAVGHTLLQRKYSKMLKSTLVYGLLVAPLALVTLRKMMQYKTGESLLWLLAYFRHPHHFITTSKPAILLLFVAVSAAGLVFYWGRNRTAFNILAITLVLSLAGILFTEILPIYTIARLQLMRTSMYAATLSLLVIFHKIGKKLPEKKIMLLTSIFILSAIVFAIVSGKTLNLETPLTGEWYETANWVKDNTPAESLFITPPQQQGFRLYAERAIVADFKCYPFLDSEALEWSNRIADLTGVEDVEDLGCVGGGMH